MVKESTWAGTGRVLALTLGGGAVAGLGGADGRVMASAAATRAMTARAAASGVPIGFLIGLRRPRGRSAGPGRR